MHTADGKMILTDAAVQTLLFRLIQSLPSPKAEPFKVWMVQVASGRVDEIQDPELAIDRGGVKDIQYAKSLKAPDDVKQIEGGNNDEQ